MYWGTRVYQDCILEIENHCPNTLLHSITERYEMLLGQRKLNNNWVHTEDKDEHYNLL